MTSSTAGFSARRLSTLSPLAKVCVRLPGSEPTAITGPNDENTVTIPIIILPKDSISFLTSKIPTARVISTNTDTVSSIAEPARVMLCFIFLVSASNPSERLFTSFSLSSPALFKTISLIPLILSRKYAENEANSARYFTPLSLSFPDEISGTTMPINRKPTSATSARYQLETNPTNRNTAVDTSTAMQMGEMVCA